MPPIRNASRTPGATQGRRSQRIAHKRTNPAANATTTEDTAQATVQDGDSDGEDCELHTYDQRYDHRGEIRTLRAGTRSEILVEKRPSHRASLVLLRQYSSGSPTGGPAGTRLIVQSQHLRKAFREVIKNYPGVALATEGHIHVSGQPRCLFHYGEELEEYASQSASPSLVSHTKLLLDHMRKTLQREILVYDAAMKSATNPHFDFEHLWMLYKPGTLLYSTLDGEDVVRRLVKIETEIRKEEEASSEFKTLNLVTEILEYDGSDCIGYIHSSISIREYVGSRPVRQLEAFPLFLHPDEATIRQKSKERTLKRFSVFGIHYKMFDGESHRPGENGRLETSSGRHRIMIDEEQAYHTGRAARPNLIMGRGLLSTKASDHLNLSEDDLLICEHRVVAFSLKSKNWGLFSISNVMDIEFDSESFSNLLFPQEKKNLIESLVKQQDSDEDTGLDDIIRGKGKGLIILLHGPPGTGKTLTAESISEFTRRPLLTISPGEIIGPADKVEGKMSELLALAARWNAVALLDEADVFMQERAVEDLERNGLVSVLLRLLEYFQGTMFLTTNRAETIDRAFHSRIQLSLSYPALSAETLRELWRDWIVRATCPAPSGGGRAPRWLTSALLDRLAGSGVNGREVKNIMRMAHALSRSAGRQMVPADILQGLEALQTFEADFGRDVERRVSLGGPRNRRVLEEGAASSSVPKRRHR